jgi:PEP-CTERM motif
VFRSAFIFALLTGTAVLSVGNTISSASATAGSTFSATSVTDADSSLNGATVTATFASGSASCTFVGGTCTAGASNFSLSLTAGDTIGATWLITNSNSSALESLVVNLQGASAAFNPCVAGSTPLTNSGECGNGGATAGSGNSESVSMANNGANATKGSAAVVYTNAVGIGSATAKGDLYTQITLSFGTTFTTGQTFTFAADTDSLVGGSTNNVAAILAAPLTATTLPEPATLGLVGVSLAALGFLQQRRKKA